MWDSGACTRALGSTFRRKKFDCVDEWMMLRFADDDGPEGANMRMGVVLILAALCLGCKDDESTEKGERFDGHLARLRKKGGR